MRLEVTHRFAIPLRDGFDYIAEPRNWPEYWPGLLRVRPGDRLWRAPGDHARVVHAPARPQRRTRNDVAHVRPIPPRGVHQHANRVAQRTPRTWLLGRRRWIRVPPRGRVRATSRPARSLRPPACPSSGRAHDAAHRHEPRARFRSIAANSRSVAVAMRQTRQRRQRQPRYRNGRRRDSAGDAAPPHRRSQEQRPRGDSDTACRRFRIVSRPRTRSRRRPCSRSATRSAPPNVALRQLGARQPRLNSRDRASRLTPTGCEPRPQGDWRACDREG